MNNTPDIAFIDFDKTIYDLQIPLFENKRQELIKIVEEKFNIRDSFYPILENTFKLSSHHTDVKNFVYNYLDEMEMDAPGYFYSYAENLLKKLSAQMPVLIVSNNSSRVIINRLKDQNLYTYIKYVYGRDTFDFYKPMGEVLKHCCEELNISVNSIKKFLFIGDSWRDYKCASDFAAKFNLSYTFLNANSLTGNEII